MDGQVIIGTKLDTKDFDAEIKYIEDQLEEIEHKLKQADMGFEVGDTAKLEAQYSKLSKQLDKLIIKNEKLNKANFSMMESSLDNVGSSITKVIKKVGKWALAVFGIRSAYLAVRNAMSTLTQYDAQLKADIDYMKNAIAFALEPVVRKIVELAQKLMFYIAYIIKAWTGKNIFENANKSLADANKEAKKLSKTLAGFDEMNVLQDTSSGGGGGATAPSFDLTSLEGTVPSWLQWIADNGETIIGFVTGLTTALTLMKVLGLDPILALGIGAIVGGVVMLIRDIIDMINDPSWQNFASILGDIAVIIGGIMLVMGNWWGLLVILVGALVKLVAENWDKVKEILGNVGSWIKEKIIDPIGNFFSGLWQKVSDGAGKAVQTVKDKFKTIVSFFSTIISKILEFFKNVGTKVGNAIAGAFKSIINSVLAAVEDILNKPISAINGLIKVVNKIPGVNIGNISTFKFPRLAKGGIINYPGKGVAIGGERGPEAVVPLTDSQQMDLLGQSIAKHMIINLTNINQLNGRVISKELQKIQAEENFAFNR